MTWPLTPWDFDKAAMDPHSIEQVMEWTALRFLQLRTFGQPERRAPMLAKLPPVKRLPPGKRWPQPWRRVNAPGVTR